MLGINGGGFFNANSAHPYENPTPLTNFIQMLAIFLIPSGLTYYLGMTVKNKKHGWSVWSDHGSSVPGRLSRLLECRIPRHSPDEGAGDSGVGNMEGKEVRFGIFHSTLFATVTTGASCGAVNSMHDSYSPLGGLIPLINIQLGGDRFRGSGLGIVRDAGFHHIGRVPGRFDGRPDPGIPRQKDRSSRRQALRLCDPDFRLSDSRPNGLGRGQPVGIVRNQQFGPARFDRNPLCFFLRQRKQRQRVCRSFDQHPDVQHASRPGHAGRTLPGNRSGSGLGREPGRKKIDPSRQPARSPFTVSRSSFS